MLQKTFTGRTVEEAVQLGLSEMNVTENQVKIDVLKPGKKGWFGFGQCDAEVNLTIIDPELKKLADLNTTAAPAEKFRSVVAIQREPFIKDTSELKKSTAAELLKEQKPADGRLNISDNAEKTADYVKAVISALDIKVTSACRIKGNDITIELFSDEAARIIGKHGQVLNALQVLAQTYFQNIQKSFVTVTIDIENYRAKRKETLETLALNMAGKAKATKRPVKFEPMPNYERKIMHQMLTRMKDIETYSEGREPNRYLVIKAK
ncbi:RNA-binding cell elongation regulator Jag/EloR [Macrococcus equipercicus]|uniref:RNA-binding protein KhpB n=1 Tax=Macrococcus equipercicus TaxID=69967 RepID=A0A9Q9F1Y2_9STAP|nr:RNA-binding cell elongation regulator Jag/EloR [Macrococcus equipercicus]UTH13796.1 protein jag [Macrococcus equipercicus]